MNRLLFWLCVALWAGVFAWGFTVTYFSSLSGQEVEKLFSLPVSDKVIHFTSFAAGGALLAGALRVSLRWFALRVILFSSVALSAFGAVDEWHQLNTPGRFGADRWDWMADTLGG